MFLVASLVSFVVLVNIVVADPTPTVVRDSPISLRIARQISAMGATELVARAQRRALNIERGTSHVRITNNDTFYTASVGVGTPPTHYNLIVDISTALTWVGGGGKHYVETNTSVNTHNSVSVTYGPNEFTGLVYRDTVTLGSDLTVFGQSIGVGSVAGNDSASRWEGVLGLGPVDLTRPTRRRDVNGTIPTVTDNLVKNRAIPSNIVSVSFEPTDKELVRNGELTFGGVDPTKFRGPVTYVPITPTFPSNQYWGFNQSIRYGDSTHILDDSAGVVDTGTVLILLPMDAFNRYINATGAILDPDTELLRITPAQFVNLQPLSFIIGGRTFKLIPNAQIWPRELNELIGGTKEYIYLVINAMPRENPGFRFTCGYVFLERFYSVFDTDNRRIGFAETRFTNSTIN